MHGNSFHIKKKKLIVVQLESDDKTEQIHKHTLKYVLYRISCLRQNKISSLSNQADTVLFLKKKEKKI